MNSFEKAWVMSQSREEPGGGFQGEEKLYKIKGRGKIGK